MKCMSGPSLGPQHNHMSRCLMAMPSVGHAQDISWHAHPRAWLNNLSGVSLGLASAEFIASSSIAANALHPKAVQVGGLPWTVRRSAPDLRDWTTMTKRM